MTENQVNEIKQLGQVLPHMTISKKVHQASKEEIEAYFKEIQEAERNADYLPFIEGLPKFSIISNSSFENFNAYNPELKKNVDRCREFVNSHKLRITLNGTVGNGKSHLAVSMLKSFPKKELGGYLATTVYGIRRIQNYRRTNGLYLKFNRFIDDLEDARQNGHKSQLFSRYTTQFDVVCLDDLELTDLTPTIKRNLYTLIDELYERKKKLIITMNCSFSDLEKFDARIADRLREDGTALAFTTQSYRKIKR